MHFEILGDVSDIETIATGQGVRERKRLKRAYGQGRWRKLKGIASVKLRTGEVRIAELHWYEATGIGRKEFKIKRFIDAN
jgi:hypothetical protein